MPAVRQSMTTGCEGRARSWICALLGGRGARVGTDDGSGPLVCLVRMLSIGAPGLCPAPAGSGLGLVGGGEGDGAQDRVRESTGGSGHTSLRGGVMQAGQRASGFDRPEWIENFSFKTNSSLPKVILLIAHLVK